MTTTTREHEAMTHNDLLEVNRMLWELDGYINRIQRLSDASKNPRIEKALDAIQRCQNCLRWSTQD